MLDRQVMEAAGSRALACSPEPARNSLPPGKARDPAASAARPLNVVLIEPEIPQNTGNIARTCACTGAVLHLVEPMGFRLTERNLKRSGCDYWDEVEVVRWPCADAFLEAHGRDELHLFTGQASRRHTDVAYGDGAFLLFGRESAGIDPAILERFADRCVRIPMREGMRSLNLSNAVAIAAYEALSQRNFDQLV